MKTGIKQRSVLSPLLFIAYIETVIEDFKEGKEEDYKNRIMVYADDITEWSTNREEIEEDIIRWNECFLRKGMKMNVDKTEILFVSRKTRFQHQHRKYDGKEYKYL